MNGVGDYRFDPNGKTTRPMMMTILARMDGCDTEGGAMEGMLDPQGELTRAEAAAMIQRFMER